MAIENRTGAPAPRGGDGPASPTELWVCFSAPAEEPPAHTLVLSFMPPRLEAALLKRWPGRCLSGRALAQEVRAEARALYLDLIARVGATPVDGQTLREALRGSDGWSRWWFLKTSEKDCEWEGDLYGMVIQLLCVKRIVDRHQLGEVGVHGGPAEFAAVVRQRYGRDRARWPREIAADLRVLATGLAGRLRLLGSWLRLRWSLGTSRSRPPFDVLLHAQWGWTLRPESDGSLRDRYFGALPAELERRGLRVGWLALCERGSVVESVTPAAAAASHPRVMPLEAYLSLRDVLARVVDIHSLARALRFNASAAFRELFDVEGFDLHRLVRRQLLGALAGPGPARLELVAAATARACADLRPRVMLTFLELFLQARAIYAGARSSPHVPALWTAQHAAYGRDKLFGVVEAKRELHGAPDACPVPAPDGIFVMGELSRNIWVENGFPEDRVVVTGGLRYQHVRIAERPRPPRPGPRFRLLVVGSLDEKADIDMCEAVAAAAEGRPFEIVFRDHPAFRRSASPAFEPLRAAMAVSGAGLEEDLAAADVVLFNHSSVAEEALLAGIPVWQWQWAGVNESVFLDLPVVPGFTSVTALQQALDDFARAPERYRPSPEVQALVFQQCFGPDPSSAASRIADAVARMAQVA